MKRKLVLTKEPVEGDETCDDWYILSIGVTMRPRAYYLADILSKGEDKLTVMVSDEPDKLDADVVFEVNTDREYYQETTYTVSGRNLPPSHCGEVLFCDEGLQRVFPEVPKTFYLQIVHNEVV